ncbi:MAG: MBL fold metallo-hydrolase [Aggregatilineales bacterium]
MSEPTLIQPVLSGPALLADIAAARPAPGQLFVWWLGQSGYAFKTAAATFYVDLYLSEHLTAKYADSEKPHIRMMAAPLRGHELVDARYVFASHKHSDHLDPGTLPDLMAASPEARLILPLALVDYAVEALGLERTRLLPMHGDDRLELDGLTVHAVPSAHPDLDEDPWAGCPYLGYVFTSGGVTFYHSGDTVIYAGLRERLQTLHPQIVFLPINGTDERRSALQVPPNMSADDAIALARELGGPLLVPHHYDMFTFNTLPIDQFITKVEAAGQPYRILRAGERTVLAPSADSLDNCV